MAKQRPEKFERSDILPLSLGHERTGWLFPNCCQRDITGPNSDANHLTRGWINFGDRDLLTVDVQIGELVAAVVANDSGAQYNAGLKPSGSGIEGEALKNVLHPTFGDLPTGRNDDHLISEPDDLRKAMADVNNG